jgi:hypothetical protein
VQKGIVPVEEVDAELHVSFSSLEFTNPGIVAGELLVRAKILDKSEFTGSFVIVRFSNVVGFRVLDESDVLDFHEEYNFAKGWLFEVLSNGWFAQESERRGFLSQHVPFYREFLFEDAENFISVISNGDLSIEFA